jgi:hypothetical protein
MGNAPTRDATEVPMTTVTNDRHTPPTRDGSATGELPRYEPPRIIARDDLEAVAAACPVSANGKARGEPGCTFANS